MFSPRRRSSGRDKPRSEAVVGRAGKPAATTTGSQLRRLRLRPPCAMAAPVPQCLTREVREGGLRAVVAATSVASCSSTGPVASASPGRSQPPLVAGDLVAREEDAVLAGGDQRA